MLLLGDSIPYGSGVEAGEAFPARLQELLDERTPQRFSIVNLAVPGMNSAQLRALLASRAARYDPDVVIAMIGANNARNASEMAGEVPPAWTAMFRGAGHHSALVRLLRSPSRASERTPPVANGRRQVAEVTNCRGNECEARSTWRLRHGHAVEVIEMRQDDEQDWDTAAERARSDFRWMHRWLQSAGIPLVLVRYPHDGVLPFSRPNQVLAELANAGVASVETPPAFERSPGGWVDLLHPGPELHLEIARELVSVLEPYNE